MLEASTTALHVLLFLTSLYVLHASIHCCKEYAIMPVISPPEILMCSVQSYRLPLNDRRESGQDVLTNGMLLGCGGVNMLNEAV